MVFHLILYMVANMEHNSGFPLDPIWGFLGVVLGWLMLSVVYRLLRGKPIFYDRIPFPRYRENCACAFSDRNLLTKTFGVGGLLVQVTDSELHIRPYFPGNLFFASEFSGMEDTGAQRIRHPVCQTRQSGSNVMGRADKNTKLDQVNFQEESGYRGGSGVHRK